MEGTDPTMQGTSTPSENNEFKRTESASALANLCERRRTENPSRFIPADRRASDARWTQSSSGRPSRPTQSSPLEAFSKSRTINNPEKNPKIEKRGKDWEGWSLNESDELPVNVQAPYSGARANLKKAPKTERIYVPQLSSLSSTDVSKQQKPTLAYSDIWAVAISPQSPAHEKGPLSPISLGPYDIESIETSRSPSPEPPSPNHPEVTKYMSAFEYAIRPYLDTHVALERYLVMPAGVQQDIPSPHYPPPRDDEISYDGSQAGDTANDVPEDGIPAHLLARDAFQINMRLVHLRTLLIQCTVLQGTIRELEGKPWAQNPGQPLYRYYSKILHLALKARFLARALRSSDLEARCEYWAGRGSGGTRDYLTAKEHFEKAIKLDVQNDTYTKGKCRLRGLRPNEKADVHFLLEAAIDHHEMYEKKIAEVRTTARWESAKHDLPIDGFLRWEESEMPPWMPDRDHVLRIAQRKFGLRKKLSRNANNLGDVEREELVRDLENKVQDRWAREGIDDRETTRRVLNEKEWKYIKKGDPKVTKPRLRQEPESASAVVSPREAFANRPASPSLTLSSSLSSAGSE